MQNASLQRWENKWKNNLQRKQSSKKKLIKLIKMCCCKDNLNFKLLFRIANNNWKNYLSTVHAVHTMWTAKKKDDLHGRTQERIAKHSNYAVVSPISSFVQDLFNKIKQT